MRERLWIGSLHGVALGASRGRVHMQINPADTGDTHVVKAASARTIEVEMTPLDDHGITDADFIKIDCEGFELDVLVGGRYTIQHSHPCIIVEQKQHKLAANYGTKGTPAVDYLKQMGAVIRKEMGGDYIMSWDQQ